MSIARLMQMGAAAPTGPEGAWDLSFAYYDPPESLAWNLATANFRQSFSVTAQEGSPEDLFFKPDGTKMYIIGISGDDVNEYDLSTAWDISTATFLQNFSVAAQETLPLGLFFKPDGTKMYVLGSDGDDVNEYDLSTAWDVSTASFLQSFSVAAQETTPQAVFFKFDGLKMYVLGLTGDSVKEYNLSTAWDISTASFLQSFSVGAQNTIPTGLFFKPDGLKMYVVGNSGTSDFVYEYNLSTAWDVSSAVYLQNFSVAAQDLIPNGIYIKPDGTAFYITGRTNDTVYQYTLGGFSVAAQEVTPRGIFFDTDGLRMYIIGTSGDDINEYSLSAAYDTSTASFVRVFDTGTIEGIPYDLFFKPDGTTLYIVGSGVDGVSQWSLSTPWNVSSISHVQSLSLAAQSVTPTGVFFKGDGTEMYVLHQAATIFVSQYSLSTAWDISTASHLQDFDVSTHAPGGSSVSFKVDGTKMYVISLNNQNASEYDLSAAWDISTASYSQSFSVSAQDTGPQGVFFHPEGIKMFIVGTITDSVYSYTLGVQP